MRLVGIELVRVEVDFRAEIGTAAGVHRVRPLLFVRVVADSGEGWGECAALADGTAVDPPLEQVERAARRARRAQAGRGRRSARGGAVPPASAVPQLFGASPVDRHMAAVLEMAVDDLELHDRGAFAGDSPRDRAGLRVDAGRGRGRDPSRMRPRMRCAARSTPRWTAEQHGSASRSNRGGVAIRCAPSAPTTPTWSCRSTPTARSGSNDDHVAELARLEDFGRASASNSRFRRPTWWRWPSWPGACSVPVCLDESLSSPQRVRDALRNGACAVACLKPARLGGMRATRSAHAECVAAGVPVFVGGFFEAGLGRASNLALAARLSQDATGLVGDLGDPADYLSVDPCGYPAVVDGWVAVPGRPGVGRPPDPDALARLDAQRHWYPAAEVAT